MNIGTDCYAPSLDRTNPSTGREAGARRTPAVNDATRPKRPACEQPRERSKPE